MSRLASHTTPAPRHTTWNQTIRHLYPYLDIEQDTVNIALLLGDEEAREVVKNRDLNIEEVLRLEPEPRRRGIRGVL